MKQLSTLLIGGLVLSSPCFALDEIKGLWAMAPLNNGIANVIDFREEGSSIAYPFKCLVDGSFVQTSAPEKSEVVYDEVTNTLTISNSSQNFKMTIDQLSSDYMKLSYVDYDLSFSYYLVEEIKPVCNR